MRPWDTERKRKELSRCLPTEAKKQKTTGKIRALSHCTVGDRGSNSEESVDDADEPAVAVQRRTM